MGVHHSTSYARFQHTKGVVSKHWTGLITGLSDLNDFWASCSNHIKLKVLNWVVYLRFNTVAYGLAQNVIMRFMNVWTFWCRESLKGGTNEIGNDAQDTSVGEHVISYQATSQR